MNFSNSEFLREKDSSLLVDFDYDKNLFEYEQNSATPLLKGRLKAKGWSQTIADDRRSQTIAKRAFSI